MEPSESSKNAPLLLNEVYGNVDQIRRIFYWILGLITLALLAGMTIVLSHGDVFPAEIIGFNLIPVSVSFFLVRRGKFELVAAMQAALFITSITWIATRGEGIHHLSILGYPVVLIVSSLVIRKRVMVLLTAYNILCAAYLVFGELAGYVHTVGVAPSVPGDFFTVAVVLIVTAVIVRLITETMFRNSANLQRELGERRRIETTMQRRGDEMTLLYRLSLSLASGQDLQSILLALQTEVAQLISSDAFYVAIYDSKNDLINYPIFFERGHLVQPGDRLLHDDPGFSGPVILDHQVLYLPDMTAPQVEEKYHPVHTGGQRMHTFLGIPLEANGRVIGMMSLQSDETDAYTPSQIQLMQAIAVQAALAIDKAHLLDQLQQELAERNRIEMIMRRRADEMTLLYQIGISLLAGQDLYHTLLALREQIGNLLEADAFYVAIYDETTDIVSYPIFFVAGEPFAAQTIRLHDHPGLTGAVIFGGASLYLPDMAEPKVDETYHPRGEQFTDLHTFFGTPLKVNNRIIGMMSVQSNTVDAYTSEQVQLMENVAVQAAIAIDKAHLLEQLQQELTERRRAEVALDFSERKFHQAFHVTPVMMTIEADHVFTDANQAFLEATGYGREEILGYRASELHLFGSDEDRRTVQDLNERQVAVHDVELHFRRKSGEIGVVLMSSDKFDINGTIYELTSALDITDRKLAEAEREKLIAELRAKNTELEQFTYVVSHDLRAPLVTVKGFVGFLEQDIAAGNQKRVHDDVKRINDATEKMELLMKELLELSRIGRMMNPPQRISFESLVHEAVQNVRGRLEARHVPVQIHPDLPAVYGDRQRLTEVLQNLIDNAAKYMGDQPQPRIEIGQRGEEAEHDMPVFFVKDNGIGIPPAYHERIFGLFNKLDPQSEGTGIGLTLVRRIIEVHGGRIWVESEPGKGTTFLFTLPQRPTSRDL